MQKQYSNAEYRITKLLINNEQSVPDNINTAEQ